MFIDAHAHLDPHYHAFSPEELIARAADAGVERLVVVGCGVEASERAVELAQRRPDRVSAAVGVHPHDVEEMSEADFDRIRALAQLPEVVAVGETGLDYHYDHSPRDLQREVFRRFIALGVEVDKPVVVHTREAEADTVEILREVGPLAAGGQIHCFTGTMALAGPAVELGWHVSFAGVVTFNNADTLRACAAELPLERLLIETDCPYLTPAPFRGRKNEPLFVPVVAGQIAALRGLSVEAVAAQTTANARRLFRLPQASSRPLAFASGQTLHLRAAGAEADEVLAAAERLPLKKIRRVQAHLPEGASPDPVLVAALEAWARGRGRSLEVPSAA